MENFIKRGALLQKVTHIALGLMATGTLAASGTVSAQNYYAASAPITYKNADPYAYGAHQAMPQQFQAPQYGAPQQFAPAPQHDLRGIDRNLYSHMKVGNPYTVFGQTYYPAHNPNYDEVGTASWYGDKFHGKMTANGEIYNKMELTAAHKTLPLNSYVIVTNVQTGQSLKVRLNDRGPFVDNRIIDLSEAAADALGIKNGGLGQVRVQYAGPAEPKGPVQQVAPQQHAQLQAPALPPMNYQPMRQMPQPLPQPEYQAQPQYAQPYAAPNYPVQPAPAPQTVAELPPVAVPNIMMPAPAMPQSGSTAQIPEAYSGQAEGGVETMTIKGPIHMAVSRSHNKARVIPAIYRTKK